MPKLSIRDASLYVEVMGRGEPMLLMHGGPGADHWSLMAFRRIADQCTLVFYDHRCNGRSTGAPASTMTWDNLTADADALRRRLGFERWTVLGHSFGGMVALEYALRYPDSLSSLILLDTGGDGRWPLERGPAILAGRGYSPATVRLARRFFAGRIEPDQMLPSLMRFGGAYYHHAGPLVLARELFAERRAKLRPEALIVAGRRLLPGWTVMDRLGEITAPTLVIAGRDDFLFPPEHQAELAARIPGSRLQIIERAGHNAHAERPEAVMAAIRAFLPVPAGAPVPATAAAAVR